MSNNQDQRTAPRFKISQMIEVRFGRERWVHAQGIDLSVTGFRCRSMEELDPGTSATLLISIGDDVTIEADAVLIHTEKVDEDRYDSGFAFTNFYGSSRSTLENYLASLG